MRQLHDVLNQLAYHPATPEIAATYASLRERTRDFAATTWDMIPEGPEKTLAYRALQQFLMYANLSVALTSPADLDTPHIARVMPYEQGILPPEHSP